MEVGFTGEVDGGVVGQKHAQLGGHVRHVHVL
jgi:hypothetical protein